MFAFVLLLFCLTLTRTQAFSGERKTNARSLMQHMYKTFLGDKVFFERLYFSVLACFFYSFISISVVYPQPLAFGVPIVRRLKSTAFKAKTFFVIADNDSISLCPLFQLQIIFPFPSNGHEDREWAWDNKQGSTQLRSGWEIKYQSSFLIFWTRYQSFLLDILGPFLLDMNSRQQHCSPTLSECSKFRWLPHSPWYGIDQCGVKRNWER